MEKTLLEKFMYIIEYDGSEISDGLEGLRRFYTYVYNKPESLDVFIKQYEDLIEDIYDDLLDQLQESMDNYIDDFVANIQTRLLRGLITKDDVEFLIGKLEDLI